MEARGGCWTSPFIMSPMLNFYSCTVDDILMKRRSLRRELSSRPGLQELRVAVLGGSTTEEVVNFS